MNHLTCDEALEFTKKHLRNEHWQPWVTDRTSRADWEAKGSKDVVQRAREKVKKVLETHEVASLDKDVEARMTEVIRRRARK